MSRKVPAAPIEVTMPEVATIERIKTKLSILEENRKNGTAHLQRLDAARAQTRDTLLVIGGQIALLNEQLSDLGVSQETPQG